MRSHALLDELQWRGLLYQNTDGAGELLSSGTASGYIGFDPTAASLHIGSLLQIMLLVHLQRHGHRPVALVGGGTGLIGDPKAAGERPLASIDTVRDNAAALERQLGRFLDFSGEGARMINNADWLVDLKAVEFMRDVGKHFTVNYMLQKESVKGRMDAGISYTEFSYMLLQAYDFLELQRRHGVRLQLGGSDQWGNITAGIELIRRTTGVEAEGITSPLVTTAAGTKFGKTEAGAVWLEATMTSPYQFFQFWVNVDDRDAGRYLRYFTLMSREEIEALDAARTERPEKREAQYALARDVTRRVHGEDALAAVEAATDVLFGGRVIGLDPRVFDVLRAEIPHFELDEPLTTQHLIDVLTTGGFFPSKGEARRAMQQGGFYLNNARVSEHRVIDRGERLHGKYLLVRKGTRNYGLVSVRAA